MNEPFIFRNIDHLIRKFISEITLENPVIINIAIKNKFEDWLKCELAGKLEKKGFKDVFVGVQI